MNNSRPLKSIRLQLARSKQHPWEDPITAISSLLRWTPRDISIPRLGRPIATNVAFADFGKAKRTKPDAWSISRVVPSMPGGCSTTIPSGDDDDELGYRFGAHKFAPGEYVSIADERGELHTFRVMSVQPA